MPADVLAPNGARPSASTVMITKILICEKSSAVNDFVWALIDIQNISQHINDWKDSHVSFDKFSAINDFSELLLTTCCHSKWMMRYKKNLGVPWSYLWITTQGTVTYFIIFLLINMHISKSYCILAAVWYQWISSIFHDYSTSKEPQNNMGKSIILI